jgi:Family of unknown function (DUF5988)
MSSADAEVEVTLRGGPVGLPETVVVRAAQLHEPRLKIPFLAGYEHFVPAGRAGDDAVFVWCDRTKLAE